MALSRRALGLGLLGLSAAGTGGYLYLRERPDLVGHLGETRRLMGFIGGEKERLLANPKVVRLLEGRFGLALDARRAGSVEQVRDPALLGQKPQFLWPSSSVLVEVARGAGVKIRRDRVAFNSPIVLYSWEKVADGLTKAGYAEKVGDFRYAVDLARLARAVIAGESFSALGVPNLFGRARIVSTDPNRSNSGFMFAGLVANLLMGDVVSEGSLGKVEADVQTLFRRMGFKPPSSGKLFDDYIAGGPSAEPLIVGYENQLVEWIVEDPARWKKVEAVAPQQPVILYPRPTVFSAHPLMSLAAEADGLIEAVMSEAVQDIAWSDHGFRGPLGSVGRTRAALFQERLVETVDAVLPMPEAGAMLALIDKLAQA